MRQDYELMDGIRVPRKVAKYLRAHPEYAGMWVAFLDPPKPKDAEFISADFELPIVHDAARKKGFIPGESGEYRFVRLSHGFVRLPRQKIKKSNKPT